MKRLLLIEEDTDVREMVAFTLENNGFEVIKAGKATTVDDIVKLNPHVVIIDPSVKQLCTNLKANDKTNPVPVIIYSASLNTDKVINNCGADGIVAKPSELGDLVYLASRLAYKN